MAWSALLLGIGLAVGTVGTLIGAGGGFLLMPLLALLYPGARPENLASISLAVVCFNAASGSIGYARQHRIDYRSGWLFVGAGIPGAIVGSFITAHIPRATFDVALGALLVAIALLMLVLGALRPREDPARVHGAAARRPALGAALSFAVGVLSSLLGIGGGIIHVPAMVYLLGFPVHLAAGTSHFVLVFTSAAGTAAHIASGELQTSLEVLGPLALGVVVGAQIGARLSKLAPPTWILRVLALALAAVGVRVILAALQRGGHA